MTKEDIKDAMTNDIEIDVGPSAYGGHLKALKKVESELEKKKAERDEVVAEMNDQISRMEKISGIIRDSVKSALERDSSAEESDSGTRSVKVPRVGVASLSKETTSLVITDASAVADELGDDFIRVKRSLDIPKVKKFLTSRDKIVDGVAKQKSRKLTIRYT